MTPPRSTDPRPADDRPERPPAQAGEVGQPGLVIPVPRLAERFQGPAPGGTSLRYEVAELLGSGANGTVFSVRDHDLERLVALKVLRNGQPSEQAQFLREARITATLEHPNIVPVHDIDRDGAQRLFFTMKRIEGETLASLIQAGTPAQRPPALSFPGVVTAFIAVGNAVAFAHAHGVIHRDIKPGNIIIGSYGEIVLADWGSAIHAATPDPELSGTPLYMSPEQARRERPGAASDIYSLGASLFHALALRPPMWSDESAEFYRRKRAGELDAPTRSEREAIPAALLAIAWKALAARSEERYSSAALLVDDLRRYQAGLAVSAHREGWLQRCWRSYRTHQQLVHIGLLVAIMVAAVAGILGHQWFETRSDWRELGSYDLAQAPSAAAAALADWTVLDGEEGPTGQVVCSAEGPGCPGIRIAHGAWQLRPPRTLLDLTWKRALPGEFRLAWTASSPSANLDFNCYIGSDRTHGLVLSCGARRDSASFLLSRSDGTVLDSGSHEPLAPRRIHAFSLERHWRRVLLTIDAVPVIDCLVVDPQLTALNQVGLECWSRSPIDLRSISISDHPLPQLVSPLEAGLALERAQDLAQAIAEYRQICNTYPGTEVAEEARFGLGRCQLILGEVAGVATLRAAIAASPQHLHVPASWYGIWRLARRTGDRDLAGESLAHLAGMPGNPILIQVLSDTGNDMLPEIAEHPPLQLADDIFPPDILARIEGGIAELRRLADAYQVPLRNNPFTDRAAAVLGQLGELQEILRLFPEDRSQQASALCAMGRFSEVLERYPEQIITRGSALFGMGRSDRILAGSFPPPVLSLVYDHGPWRADQLPADCDARTRCDKLLREGRLAEVLGPAYRAEVDLQALALLRSQRSAEALRLAGDEPGIRARALLQDRRFLEVLEGCPAQLDACMEAAVGLALAGDRSTAAAAFAALGRRPLRYAYRASWVDTAPELLRLAAPLLQLEEGGSAPLREALTAIADGERYRSHQVPWYLAGLVLGRLDEGVFLAQPCQAGVQERLLFARALRAELAGAAQEACTWYQRMGAAMGQQPFLQVSVALAVNHRCQLLGLGPVLDPLACE